MIFYKLKGKGMFVTLEFCFYFKNPKQFSLGSMSTFINTIKTKLI